MGVHEGTKKILVASYYPGVLAYREPDRTDTGISCRTIHLHDVLTPRATSHGIIAVVVLSLAPFAVLLWLASPVNAQKRLFVA